MYKTIQKFLDWGIKLASLAVTGPATWIVAGELFRDVTIPAVLYTMQFCAVFLVEGVLLSNWLLLEYDKAAAPELKARYGLTALAMYAAMLIVAWRHEGPVGLIFRGALLAALLGSGWDTYVHTWQVASARADRSIERTGKVRRHARKLAARQEIARLDSEHVVAVTRIDHAQQVALADASRQVAGQLAAIQAQPATPRRTVQLDSGDGVAPDNPPARVVNLDPLSIKLLGLYRDNPALSLTTAGRQAGVSRQTVSNRLGKMEAAGVVHRNGVVKVLVDPD